MDIDEFLDRELAGVKKEPILPGFLKEKPDDYEETLDKINEHIEKNELVEAEKLYSDIWSKIKDKKLTWNENLYITLTEINKRLTNRLNNLYSTLKEKINIIYGLMARARDDLRKGKNELAVSVYSEIMDIFNSIPNAFLVDKRKIYNEILALYRELKANVDKEFFNDFNSKISQINSVIYSTKVELQKNNIQAAINYYTSCLNLYNALPNGFFTYKIQLSSKILELYKEITVILEISNLKSKLKPEMEKESLKRTEFIQKKFSETKTPNEELIKK